MQSEVNIYTCIWCSAIYETIYDELYGNTICPECWDFNCRIHREQSKWKKQMVLGFEVK